MRAASLLLALALAGCASWQAPVSRPDELPEAVRAALRDSGLPAASLGVVARPLDGSVPGLALRADDAMAPGSAMKLVTAVVSLDVLGINHRGRTELLASAAPQDGVIAGELILRGGADPDLDWPALWWLLRQLRESGVREIRGGLRVDRTLFTPERPDLGQPPFDEAPEFPYNVIPDALHLNGSLLDYELSADGQRVSARSLPALPGLRVDASAMHVGAARCKDWDEGWKPALLQPEGEGWRLTLQGEFPRDCQRRAALQLVDRQWLTVQMLRRFWTELGGSLGPGDEQGPTPAGAVLLASHQGRPLAELLRPVLKSSDNALTRLIYLQLGAQAARPGEPTQAAADRVVRQWLQAHGLDDRSLVLDNGSGLSRSERISPALMAGLLRVAQAGRQAPELQQALPIAGLDGTMTRRLKASPAAGLARLKTGTLRDAVGLAGYIPDARGRLWVFAAMVNDPQAGAKGRVVLDALADWVARQH